MPVVPKQVGRSYVNEEYKLNDGRLLRYKQPEGSFSNPNASVCIGTLNWLCDVSSWIEGAKVQCSLREEPQSGLPEASKDQRPAPCFLPHSFPFPHHGSSACSWQDHDFMELYCGNGNHTVGEEMPTLTMPSFLVNYGKTYRNWSYPQRSSLLFSCSYLVFPLRPGMYFSTRARQAVQCPTWH